jgi:hypothetical protein
MTVPYLPFAELPEEIQSEIVEKLPPESHAKIARVSKSLKRITDATKCQKKAEYYKLKDKDPVREVIRDNDIGCFQYFLDKNFPVYWGTIVEMVYLKRNDMLRLYDFEVRNTYRIELLLRILLETNNAEGYDILKSRIRPLSKQRFSIFFFKGKIHGNLITKITREIPNIVFGNTSEPFERVSMSIKSLSPAKLREVAHIVISDTIAEDDLEALKILHDLDDQTIFDHIQSMNRPVEKDIFAYLLRWKFDLSDLFASLVINGNLYSVENALDAGFKPSAVTINYILEIFRDSAASGDLPPDDILDWLYSRRIITKEEYDDILREFS